MKIGKRKRMTNGIARLTWDTGADMTSGLSPLWRPFITAMGRRAGR